MDETGGGVNVYAHSERLHEMAVISFSSENDLDSWIYSLI